jgi:hypothetical protein
VLYLSTFKWHFTHLGIPTTHCGRNPVEETHCHNKDIITFGYKITLFLFCGLIYDKVKGKTGKQWIGKVLEYSNVSLISMPFWHLPEVTGNNYGKSQFWKPESCWSLNQTTPKYSTIPALLLCQHSQSKTAPHTEYGAPRTVSVVKNLKQQQQSIPAG